MARLPKTHDAILQAALSLADIKPGFTTTEVIEQLPHSVSRVYVSRVLNELVQAKRLTRSGSTRNARYHAVTQRSQRPVWQQTITPLKGASDYLVLEQAYSETPALLAIKEDVRSIFSYAFTEMLNNAIDHSRSAQAEVAVTLTDRHLGFTIRDFGVGVFRNVQTKFRLKDEFEAMQELLKGKTTTAPQAHSGEGIYFTSKIADLFILRSFGYELRVDNRLPDMFPSIIDTPLKGTEVQFQIALDSAKHLQDVFRAYYTDPVDQSFDKTHAYVKLYTTGTIYVSRSQAKRILHGLDIRQFKEIILDFQNVPTVGQAFVDEIFRVYKQAHPDITLTPINCNEAVTFMITRATPNTPGQRSLL